MGNGMNKILDGVYVGNIRDARATRQHVDNKITHILSIHDQAETEHKLPDMKYCSIAISDTPSEDITRVFEKSNDFIHQSRLDGGNVLIHCLAGVSRSVTVTVAYIMTISDLSWREALNAVRGSRRCANPNFGFQRQLQTFEYTKLAQEKKRFKAKFPAKDFNDMEQLKKLLEMHQNWVLYGDEPASDEKTYPLAHNAYKNTPKD
ncbi:dual specificity protein phosphatase 22-like [Tubulanus polymorphus]|uniref:dual specificity protein phosphatase 22-like n=1 Tax=Tubulanus polymorphus TaxID=672921 RepID=UPI003DA33EE9